MKEIYVADLKEGMSITEFFMVRQSSIKVGKSDKEYLDIMLMDKTGDLSGKKWDVDPDSREQLAAYKAGDLVRVRGEITDWKGQTQIRISRIRPALKEDGLLMKDFVKTAPEDSESMYAFIMGRIDAMEDEELKRICRYVYEENHDRLLYYPAAMSNHHAEYGGLLYHVKRMMMMGERACEVYTFLSRDLLIAGIALHDIEKLTEIKSDKNGVSPGYTVEGNLLGHLVMGVSRIEQLARELDISHETAMLLEHMILSHHYLPEYGSPKKPLFPEAELLHHIDNIDAKLFDMEEALATVKPGEFSDRVYSLDNRRLYKAKRTGEGEAAQESGANPEPKEG